MPELPEVEVVKNELNNLIINKTVTNIFIHNPKLLKNCNTEELKNNLINKKILNLSRIGKYIIFEFHQVVLVSHLRMEGKYLFKNNYNNHFYNKHNMISFELDNKDLLIYLDTRQFGTMHLFKKDEYKNSKIISKLGKEPFDNTLTIEFLKEKWKNKTQAIKSSLLDQRYILGIGNIYADEILFACKIHPQVKTNLVKDEELNKIIKNSLIIFKESIKNKGTSIKTFETINHNKGNYQKLLKVHSRKGLCCFVCNNIIQKIKVSNRGTYYCINCQKY